MNFPNLLELSFLAVLAFPNASRRGLEAKTCYSIEGVFNFYPIDSAAKYFRIIFVDSVFPDPLSPEIIIEHILVLDLAVSSKSCSNDIWATL